MSRMLRQPMSGGFRKKMAGITTSVNRIARNSSGGTPSSPKSIARKLSPQITTTSSAMQGVARGHVLSLAAPADRGGMPTAAGRRGYAARACSRRSRARRTAAGQVTMSADHDADERTHRVGEDVAGVAHAIREEQLRELDPAGEHDAEHDREPPAAAAEQQQEEQADRHEHRHVRPELQQRVGDPVGRARSREKKPSSRHTRLSVPSSNGCGPSVIQPTTPRYTNVTTVRIG